MFPLRVQFGNTRYFSASRDTRGTIGLYLLLAAAQPHLEVAGPVDDHVIVPENQIGSFFDYEADAEIAEEDESVAV
jgi:hypothetical protein